jgi:hypothetical protein
MAKHPRMKEAGFAEQAARELDCPPFVLASRDFLDLDLALGLDGLGLFRRRDLEHAFVKFGFDLGSSIVSGRRSERSKAP